MAAKKRESAAKGAGARVLTRSASASSDGDAELSAFEDKVIAALPEARVTRKFHNASFNVKGKVFAFTRSSGGVALKLPESGARALVEARRATVLVMGKRAMREWVVVPRTQLEDNLDLLRESFGYVASLPERK